MRPAPQYRLLRRGQLPDPLPPWLAPFTSHPRFGGLLVPGAGEARAPRVVSRETAAFLAASPAARRPPASFGSNIVRALVLDGVLEVKSGRTYLGGAAAYRLCFPTASPSRAAADDSLSSRALRRTAELGLTDPSRLGALLYAFNTLPATPELVRRYPDASVVERELLRDMPRSARGNSRCMTRSEAWLSWHRASARAAGAKLWKLYVSAPPAALPHALHVALAVPGAVSVKVGRDLFGLLRPDKLVLYFPSCTAMMRAAHGLHRALEGVPAQGVPFTGQLFGAGLLSWGVDAMGEDAEAPWSGDRSWRAWLTHRLASALAQAAREQAADVPAWQFAMDRVSLDGVNVAEWIPAARVKSNGHH